MNAQPLYGKPIAEKIFQRLRSELSKLSLTAEQTPSLAVIQVGNNPASTVYVRNKRIACSELGFRSFSYDLPEKTTQTELMSLINELNQNPEIHGILLQLPLPAHLQADLLLEAIDPKKDVDGFHPYHLGRLAQGKPSIRPCTPYAVMTLLQHHGLDCRGKHAVVIGASNIVGKPMALELLAAKATVTVCNSQTRDLSVHLSNADIVIAAIGKPEVISTVALKPGVIAIDIGITRNQEGQLIGDLDAAICQERTSHYTPVPGGVGPMTIAMLMVNTFYAATGVRLDL